ncbi:MAG: endo alpha-1,4 polygalactosaminidase [Dehalococcoidia bacterium]
MSLPAHKTTILIRTTGAAALLLALAACAGNGDQRSGDSATRDEASPDGSLAVWTPAPGATWQWQLQDDIDTSLDVDVYDIDLFDAPQSTIDALHEDGRAVICYFSAGSLEDGREDAGRFQPSDAGNRLENWPDERWLDVRSANVRAIMEDRLDIAVARGCDAIEPDNVDAFQNDSGFSLTADDQLDYNRFLASAAHARGLSVGLKNALDLVDELEPGFDWALNEECLAYDECGALAPFLDAGKAVFHVEYVEDADDGPGLLAAVCDDPAVAGFSTLVKTPDLGAWRLACD